MIVEDRVSRQIARDRVALLRTVTEEQLQTQIIDEAKLRGWRIQHARPARTDRGWRTPLQGHPGFPDLVLARRGRLLFWELKRYGAKPRPDQVVWLAELGQVPGVEVRVVTPADWEYVRGALA